MVNKEEIIERVEEIQDKVDAIGFKGNNEHNLYLRLDIADYITNQLNDTLNAILKEIDEAKKDSCNPDTLTKRGSDYRIGLTKAFNIISIYKIM